MKNLLLIKYKHEKDGPLPSGEALSNTPLNEALVASKVLIEQHKRNYNLDIVNLIVVHDGESDSTQSIIGNGSFSSSSNVVIKDPKTKFQIKIM